MSLEEDYLFVYDALKDALRFSAPTNNEVIPLIDLTLLDEAASDNALLLLNQKAHRHQVAAICVYPQHLKKISSSIVAQPFSLPQDAEGKKVKLATVVNFPEGDQSTQHVLTAVDNILSTNLADEIDYVFPHQFYLEGEQKEALKQCQQTHQLCKQAGITFKVILETGALPSLAFIYQLSMAVIGEGCDFLKTSTGKIAQGATFSAAFAILKAIKDSKATCGLKVSGGIKKPEQALTYMALAKQMFDREPDKSWFRIGASSLLDELIN